MEDHMSRFSMIALSCSLFFNTNAFSQASGEASGQSAYATVMASAATVVAVNGSVLASQASGNAASLASQASAETLAVAIQIAAEKLTPIVIKASQVVEDSLIITFEFSGQVVGDVKTFSIRISKEARKELERFVVEGQRIVLKEMGAAQLKLGQALLVAGNRNISFGTILNQQGLALQPTQSGAVSVP